MKYLDEKLALLNTVLVKENLSRVLEALWELLLQAILQALGANLDVSADFYGRFHFALEALVNFFHAEGQGLPLESLRDGSYKVRPGLGASGQGGVVRAGGRAQRPVRPAEAGGGAASASVLHPRVHRAVLPGQAQAGSEARGCALGLSPRSPPPTPVTGLSPSTEVPGAEPVRAPERPLPLRGRGAETGGGGPARRGPAPAGRQWPE